MQKPAPYKLYGHFFFAGIGILILALATLHYFATKTSPGSANTFSIMSLRIPILQPHQHTISNDVVDSINAKGHSIDILPVIYTFPEDTWVTRIDLIVNNAPSSIIHHIFLENIDKPSPLCPKYGNDLIVTMGSETLPFVRFPAPYAFFFKKGTRVALKAMLHNPLPPEGEGGTYHDVSVGFKLTEANETANYKPVSFYLLFLDMLPHCTGASDGENAVFTVPAHTAGFTKSSDTEPGENPTALTFPQNGVIVTMGGHLHPWEGGKKIDVFLNQTQIETFEPVHIPPLPWTWETPARAELRPVAAGDRLSFTATYTNPNSVPLTDAMGIVGLYFSPDMATTTTRAP